MLRSSILQGSQLSGVQAFDANPVGTYLWVLHDAPSKLSRIKVANGNVIQLFDSVQIPELDRMLNKRIYPVQHISEGIQWIVEGLDPLQPLSAITGWLVFTDINLDGTWGWGYYSEGLFLSLYLLEDWVKDYVHWHN